MLHTQMKAEGLHISVYNQNTTWVSNFYNITRSLDCNNRFTARVRRSVAQNPDTAQVKKYTSCFNQHTVFEFLARYPKTSEYRRLSDDQKEIFWRRKLAFTCGADGHMRAHDQKCMRTTSRALSLTDRNGRPTAMDNLRSKGHCLAVSLWDTKTHKGNWSPTIRISKCRPAVIRLADSKCTLVTLSEYGQRARHRKANMWGHTSADGKVRCKLLEQYNGDPSQTTCDMPQCEHNHVFVSTTLCNRAPGTKVQQAGVCAGRCGRYHPVDAQTIANDRLWAMRHGDVPAEYKSHALRGNSEVITIRASAVSDMFDIYEAMRRARHSMATQLKYYEREPHPAWVRALANMNREMQRSLSVEEAQRIGHAK